MSAPPKWRFFTDDEAALWDALADTLWPPTAEPGGAELGATRYLDLLLSAFDSNAPLFYADDAGTEPVPLDPVMEHSFRLQLYGSSVVPYPNEAVLGPVIGLRSQVRDGLANARATLPPDFATRGLPERFVAWKSLDADFRDLVLELVCQALWSNPAYGGNAGEQGWAAIHLEGRGQPTGYSIWDDALNAYRERPDFPMSTADTTPDPDPMSSDVRTLLDTVTQALGGVKT
ncbi:MAG: hypothetical protein U0228_23485 [Myxococcaceae bacterium]